MTIIGTFILDDGAFEGAIQTLTLDVITHIRPTEKVGKWDPDYRVYGPNGDIGAAWKKSSKGKDTYLEVKLDDPIFPAPLSCVLAGSEHTVLHRLVWKR